MATKAKPKTEPKAKAEPPKKAEPKKAAPKAEAPKAEKPTPKKKSVTEVSVSAPVAEAPVARNASEFMLFQGAVGKDNGDGTVTLYTREDGVQKTEIVPKPDEAGEPISKEEAYRLVF